MKKITFILISFAVAGSMCGTLVFAQAAPEKGKITITPATPMSVDAVVSALKTSSFDQAIIQGSFTKNGQTDQDFITINPGQSADDVKTKWSDARKSLIAQLTKDGYFPKNAKTTSLSPAASVDDLATFAVKNLTLYGEQKPTAAIANKFQGVHSDFQSSSASASASPTAVKTPIQIRPVTPIDSTGGVAPLAAANTPYYTLLPNSGSVSVGLYTAPGVTTPTRGVVNYMTWASNKFASDQTYEHDFFLDSAGGTYFARYFTLQPYCQPMTLYWATSWPAASYPYLDFDLEAPTLLYPSGYCSNSGNIAYTIGAAQASAITPGTTHFTAMLMSNGDATTDTFLLQGQVGYRYPTSCYSTLCSFGYGYASGYQETTHYGLKSGTVPGTASWTVPSFLPNTPVPGINLGLYGHFGTIAPITNITSSSLTLNFVDITWDETHIYTERSIGSSGPWSTFDFGILNAGNAPGGWSWNNTGLASHTTYCYRLRATNNNGSSAYSSVVCGTTL